MPAPHNHGADPERIERELGMPLTSPFCDSRRPASGGVFFAYPGCSADGRDHIGEAVRAGAAGVLWDPEGFSWDGGWETPNVPVPGLKRHASLLAGHAFGHPSRDMSVYAVTGTEGKTTTAWFLAGLLGAASGGKVACFSTVGQGLFGALGPAELTTPDAVGLQRGLAEAHRAGARAAVVEASSHGIGQHRLAGVDYGIAVLTNFGRDHLDYHGSVEEYARAKEMLFERAGLEGAVLNADDALGQRLAERLDGRVAIATFGCGLARARLLDVRHADDGMEVIAELDGYGHEWAMRAQGRHNALNALAAACAARLGGWRWGEILPGMESLAPPPGRMQRIAGPAGSAVPAVYVDYAHAPHALERALAHLREIHPGRRLTCVFGCGGDRDRGKRGEMGRIAAERADRVLVTTDNPRSEDPDRIIAEIMAGAGAEARAVPRRTEAIFAAVREAGPGDVVLVAGKGHEKFQLVGGSRVPFDDAEVAAAALREVAR